MKKQEEEIYEGFMEYEEYTEYYEGVRDKAFQDGIVKNAETLSKLSHNELELKRHQYRAEMERIQKEVDKLWKVVAKKTCLTLRVQHIMTIIVILLFTFLLGYVLIKTSNIFLLIAVAIVEFATLFFLKTEPAIGAINFFTGLIRVCTILDDYYEKYGDLESLLRLSDYRNLESKTRKNLLNPHFVKDSDP